MGEVIDNTLGTNIFGGNANEQGLQSQTAATQQAMGTITNAYKDSQGYLKPWESTGQSALGQLAGNNFMSGFSGSPALQFQLKQAETATNNAMARRGLGNSGAALKALQDRAQGIASQDYQQQYQNEFNRLNALAGYGNNAATNMSNAAMGYGQNIANLQTGLGDAQAAAAMGRANQTGNLVNNLFSLAGAKGKEGLGAAFSDERLKKNLVPVSKEDLDELRKDLKAFYYDYKDQIHGGDRWIGIMAQDLEKTKFGKAIVSENAKGEKMIDMHRVLSVFLATLAEVA